MSMLDWIYASSGRKPEEKETVLCDMGKAYEFCIMKYENGVFCDVNTGKCYGLGYNIKRWAHIGKHCDEQF